MDAASTIVRTIGTALVDEASLFYRIDPQHLVKPSLVVLFIKCVDDAQHNRIPYPPMKTAPLLFRNCFMAGLYGFDPLAFRASRSASIKPGRYQAAKTLLLSYFDVGNLV